jgi:hypothetical protein
MVETARLEAGVGASGIPMRGPIETEAAIHQLLKSLSQVKGYLHNLPHDLEGVRFAVSKAKAQVASKRYAKWVNAIDAMTTLHDEAYGSFTELYDSALALAKELENVA